MPFELSLNQLKEPLIASPSDKNILADFMIGEYVIVRTYSAGVHAGTLVARNGLEVVLKDTQRLWRWQQNVKKEYDAGALTGVALHGIKKDGSKVSEILPQILLTEAVEVIPASKEAEITIKTLSGWEC